MIEFELQTMQQKQEGEPSSHRSSSSSNNNNNDINASPSPSFSSYSSETLAEIAARVIDELRRDPHSGADDDDADALFPPWETDNDDTDSFIPRNDEREARNDDDDEEEEEEEQEEEEEFEFAFVSRDLSSPVSADDIFYNGQIRPMYPIFDRNLLYNAPANDAVSNNSSREEEATAVRRRLPLRKLMFEEGETASCSSSTDESVDLEGAAEGSYCVWTPNSVGRERKKSNSTGSASKRWKLRDLLLRSHSDGKDHSKQRQQVMLQIPSNKVAAKPPHEAKTRTVAKEHGGVGEQNKRKSFLPYRPELVGLFANVNGLGKNLSPF